MARCVCPSGYEGDPNDCQDVDECAGSGSNDCAEHAVCTNRIGGFECECSPGYEGDGHNCSQVSSCTDGQSNCHPDATCLAEEGSIRCLCREGYQGDGRSCGDLDECQTDKARCGTHAHCSNTRGSYDCTCDATFEGDAKEECQDSCEVASRDAARCDPGGQGRCSFDVEGRASCRSCKAPHVGDGRNCRASAECERLRCGDNTVCAGEDGSLRCECAKGFSGDPASGCQDIDECSGASGCDEANSRCLNKPGGHVCVCADGFERLGNDGKCVNIDECARDQDLCDPAAKCIDTTPGYRCECKPGYEGDGRACADIDECERDKDICSSASNTVCRNTPGGHECACPDGFTGDGKNQACTCDLTGYWGARIDTEVIVKELAAGDVVLIAPARMRTFVWELRRYRYDGNELKIDSAQCGMSEAPEIYSPLYDEVYSLQVPHASFDPLGLTTDALTVPLPRADALPGKPFDTPREAVLMGVQLNDPLNDPWWNSVYDVPASAWVDYDRDGQPGMTWWPLSTDKKTQRGTDETYDYLPVELKSGSSLVSTRVGCISTGIRMVRTFKGRIDSCTRMTGRMEIERFDSRVQGCTLISMSDWEQKEVSCTEGDWRAERNCTQDQLQFIDEQDLPVETGGQFELVKLGDMNAKIDCAKVRAALPALPRR